MHTQKRREKEGRRAGARIQQLDVVAVGHEASLASYNINLGELDARADNVEQRTAKANAQVDKLVAFVKLEIEAVGRRFRGLFKILLFCSVTASVALH